MAFPTTGVLDSFTGSNGTDLHVYSANWQSPVAGVTALEIQSNAATGTVAGVNWQTWATSYGASQEVYVTASTAPTTGQSAGVFYRVVNESSAGTTDGYYFQYSSGTFTLFRVDNGAQTAIGAGITQTLSSGDAFGAFPVGGTHSLQYKASGGSWGELATRSDSTYTAGGKLSLLTTGTSVRFDGFGGGTATVSYTRTASLTAAIQAARTATASATVAVQQAQTATASSDAAVQGARAATATTASAVQAALSAVATIDAAVQEGKVVSAAATAAVSEARAAVSSLTAAVQAAVSVGASVDVATLAAISVSTTVSAYIESAGASAVSASLSAAIQAARNATASLTAAVQESHAATSTLDAAVAAANSVSASTDAAVQAPVSVQSSLSAAVSAAVSAAAQVSAAVRISQSATATTDAYIAAASILTATTSAAIQASVSTSVTLSVYVVADLTDAEKLSLILKILSNRQVLDPVTGTYRLYDDDDATILYEVAAWEDTAGTIPYRGRGLRRLDALE